MTMIFWTREEEARLVSELRDGSTIEDIAAAHRRTPSAVLARTSSMTPEDLGLRSPAQRTEWLREQLLTNPHHDWLTPLLDTRRRQREEVRARAPRTGAVWTPAEDEQVVAAATAGTPVCDLAAQLQRSTASTARRIHHLSQPVDAASSTDEAGGAAAPGHPAETSTAVAAPAAVEPPEPVVPTAGPAHPAAHGQPWTREETFQLIEELHRGHPVADVAATHRRSVRAVNGRSASILTHLTGVEHALAEDSAEQLRALLDRSTATPAPARTPSPSRH